MPIKDTSASRTILVTLAVIMFISVMAFVVLQNMLPKGTRLIRSYDDGYIDGFTKARDLAKSAWRPAAPPSMSSTSSQTTISGTVNNVGSSTFTITAKSLVLDERVDGVGLERTIKITKNTKIITLQMKPGDAITKENEKYREAIKAETDPMKRSAIRPPSSLAEVPITFSDISAGDTVIVTGEMGIDVATVNPIQASRIIVQKINAAPGTQKPGGSLVPNVPTPPPIPANAIPSAAAPKGQNPTTPTP
jgi:hypothetical protein